MFRDRAVRWLFISLSAVLLSACVSDIDPDRVVEQEPVQQATFAPRVKVAIVTKGDDDVLWDGVTAIPNTDVSNVSPGDYESADKSQWGLVVFDAYQPKAAPKVPAFYFGTVPPNSSIRIILDAKGTPVMDERFAINKFDNKNPLMKDVFLNEMPISQALKLNAAPTWQVLASGDGDPMILANKSGNGAAQIVLAFKVDETQWTLHYPHDFPTFMTNAFQWMTAK